MRKLFYLLALTLLAPFAVLANQNAQGWCESGAQIVVTSGLQSTTQVQASYPLCTITVFVHGGGLAAITSDNSGTPLANPFTSQTNGRWLFYAPNGRYDITMTGAGLAAPVTYSDVYLNDSGSATGGLFGVYLNVSFGSAITFNAGAANIFGVTLTGNNSSSTVLNPQQTGQAIVINLCQDNAGNRAFTFPANFLGTGSFILPKQPNLCTPTMWFFDGLNWRLVSVFTGPGAFGYATVAFAGSMTFSSDPVSQGYANTIFDTTLTGNVTSSVFTTTGPPGTIFQMDLLQGGPGGWTFTFPANAVLPSGFVFDTVAGHHNQVAFRWNGTTWDAWNVIGSGGTTSPGSPLNSIQKNAAGIFGSTPETSTGGFFTIGEEFVPKGPSPYIDPRFYGVRGLNAAATPAIPGITGTISSSSTSLTVSTSVCSGQTANQCFVNGDGIVVVGAGPTQSMTAPTPTVVPSVAAGPTGTTVTVPGPTGATTYNYKIVAVDKGRGMTVPSAATTIVNGKANLGSRSVGITSIARSGLTNTVLTSSPHELVAGAVVIIKQVADGSFSGTYIVSSVSDNTHFTYFSGFDTASGAAASSTGGTVYWFNENFITWSHVTGAHQYIVCSDRGGAGYAAIGISAPDNTANLTTDMALAFDDLGSPMRDNFQLPYWAGANPCTAGSPQNDELVTTITSGAPGTGLTLAAAASTSVTNSAVLFDNAPNLLTAVQAAGQGPVNIPFSSTGYVINSYLTLPTQHNLCQVGAILLNDTIQLGTGGRWSGACPPANGPVPSSAWQGFPGIAIGPAYPGFYQSISNMEMDSVQFTNSSGGTNGKMFMLLDLTGVPSGTLGSMNFQTGTNANDYMSMGLVIRGTLTNSPSTVTMRGNFDFTSGGPGTIGSTTTPLFYADPGGFIMDNVSLAGRGIAIKTPSQPFGTFALIHILYMNGGVTPLVTMIGGGASLFVHVGVGTIDTVGLPMFANLNAAGSKFVIDDLASGPNFDGVSFPPLVSGFSTPVIGASVGTGYTRTTNFNTGTGLSSIFPAGTNLLGELLEAELSVGVTHSIFVNALPIAAPTATVTAGGSVPVGSITYKVVPVWQNGGEGNYSLPATFTTTGGNQTVNLSWTAAPGNPLGYNIYRGNTVSVVLLSCSIPATTATSFVDTSASACGQSAETLPTGGPSMWMPGVQGGAAPKFQGGGYASTPTPTKTSTYTVTKFDNIIPVNASAGGFTVFLDQTIIGSHWVILRIDNVPGNTLTVAPLSGTIDGAASTTISALSGKIFTCTATGCETEATSSGGGGGGNVLNAAQFSFPYYSASGSNNVISGISPPTSNSNWVITYQVVGGVALAPTVGLLGVPVIQLTSSASLDFSYRTADVRFSSCTTPTLTLPAASGTTASNMVFTILNGCSGNVTITSTTPNSINGGGAGGSVTLFPGWRARITQDNTPNWWAVFDPTFTAYTAGCTAITFSATTGLPCATLPVVSNVNSQTANYTSVAGDNGKIISMNGSNLTLTLPASPPAQPYGIFIQNLNATSLTVARNGLNIDGAAANITVPQNQGFWLSTDGSNYFTSRGLTSATAGVSSLTGDGALISNSGSTGAVTLSLGNAAAHKFWGNNTGSSGPPSYFSIGTGDVPAVLLRNVCTITVGDTSGSAITNAQLGPQKKICFVPAAATVIEIEVTADGGTPNVIVGRNRAGTTTNLLSGALATAASGAIACSNTGGTTGLDGTTTCSSTLQNTATNAGDFFELVSGTAGGTAKLFSANIVYTIN